MSLKVLTIPDPRLRRVCADVSLQELRTTKLQDLIEEMLEIVYGKSNKGEGRDRNRPMTVGLSANQVGIFKKISIVDLAIGRKRFSDVHVLINPEIIWHSKSVSQYREGCVSLPKIWGIVPRYKGVKVRAFDRSCNELFIYSKGWSSVLLQHEIDHLKNPKKAQFVKEQETGEYRKKYKEWRKYIDVSKWVCKSKVINNVVRS